MAPSSLGANEAVHPRTETDAVFTEAGQAARRLTAVTVAGSTGSILGSP
jgi:hypothetical protein